MLKQFATILPLLCTVCLHAQPMTSIQEAMIQDLDAVKYHMSIKYAPKEWKNEFLGWTLDSACDTAKGKIADQDLSTSKEYQKVFKDFLLSTQDYHVKPIFYSTELSLFPMQVKKVQGKYYLSFGLDLHMSLEDFIFFDDMDDIEDQYDLALSTLQPGDEIVALDGMPIQELIEEIVDDQFGGNRTPTGYALAEKSLFIRYGKYGNTVPQGLFQITVRHKGSVIPRTYTLPWLHVPEWVMNKTLAKGDAGGDSIGAKMERYMKRDFKVQYAEELLTNPLDLLKHNHLISKANSENENEEEDIEDHREKGMLPELGEVIWETEIDQDIYAYLFKSPKGQKIGYLYLPTFNYDSQGAEGKVEDIAKILKHFNKESAALVLDITNNPGGNLFYTYGVLSTLTSTPMIVPSEREIIIQEDVYRAALIYKFMELEEAGDGYEDDEDFEGATLSGYSFSKEVLTGIKNYCREIIDSWEAGKTFTDPLYIYGIDKIMPHPEVQYNNPILLLVNELDFSCGDFFPAILQDNQRATLFGKTTAGAGGYVRGYQHSSRFGVMAYTLTGSIAMRPNGNPIENLGVTPDIHYIRAVNHEIQKLIK
jgi:hypothetical protein